MKCDTTCGAAVQRVESSRVVMRQEGKEAKEEEHAKESSLPRRIRVGTACHWKKEDRRVEAPSSLVISLRAGWTLLPQNCMASARHDTARHLHRLRFTRSRSAVYTVTSHACTGPIDTLRAAVGAHATPLLGSEHARPTHPKCASCAPPFALPLLFYIRADTPLLALYCGPGGRVGNLQRTSARSTLATWMTIDAWPRREHVESTHPGGICPGGKGIPGGAPGNPGGRNPGGMLRAKSDRHGHRTGPTNVPMRCDTKQERDDVANGDEWSDVHEWSTGAEGDVE